jgi:hypothetical protein
MAGSMKKLHLDAAALRVESFESGSRRRSAEPSARP